MKNKFETAEMRTYRYILRVLKSKPVTIELVFRRIGSQQTNAQTRKGIKEMGLIVRKEDLEDLTDDIMNKKV